MPYIMYKTPYSIYTTFYTMYTTFMTSLQCGLPNIFFLKKSYAFINQHQMPKTALFPSLIITTFTNFTLMFMMPLHPKGTRLILPLIKQKRNQGHRRACWDHYFTFKICKYWCEQYITIYKLY